VTTVTTPLTEYLSIPDVQCEQRQRVEDRLLWYVAGVEDGPSYASGVWPAADRVHSAAARWSPRPVLIIGV